MKRRLCFLGGLALLTAIVAGVCFGGTEDDRFKGGTYDGYNVCTTTNTTILSGVVPSGAIFKLF